MCNVNSSTQKMPSYSGFIAEAQCVVRANCEELPIRRPCDGCDGVVVRGRREQLTPITVPYTVPGVLPTGHDKPRVRVPCHLQNQGIVCLPLKVRCPVLI